MTFIKLSNIQSFSPTKFLKAFWFKWNPETKTASKSDTYQEGHKLMFEWECSEGVLSLSRDQMQQMLLASWNGTESNPLGKTFSVKTNGKTGMEIRYFINLKSTSKPVSDIVQEENFTSSGKEDFPF